MASHGEDRVVVGIGEEWAEFCRELADADGVGTGERVGAVAAALDEVVVVLGQGIVAEYVARAAVRGDRGSKAGAGEHLRECSAGSGEGEGDGREKVAALSSLRVASGRRRLELGVYRE